MDKKEKYITVEVMRDFKFAYRGCDVVAYGKGQIVEVNEECAEIAMREKWIKPAKSKALQVDDPAAQLDGTETNPAAPIVPPPAE